MVCCSLVHRNFNTDIKLLQVQSIFFVCIAKLNETLRINKAAISNNLTTNVQN